MKDDEEAKNVKRDPLKRLAGIVKQSAFFQNMRFEISFIAGTSHSANPELSRNTITETEPSHVPQIEPSKAWKVISQQNHTNNIDSEDLPFVILKTGEIAFPLQFPIAINKSFEGKEIKLSIVVTPVSFPDQQQRRLDGILSYLLNSTALQRFPHQRATNQIVKLLQPLHVSILNITICNYKNFFKLCIY